MFSFTIVACFQNSTDFSVVYTLVKYAIITSSIQFVSDNGKVDAIDLNLAPLILVQVRKKDLYSEEIRNIAIS